MKEILVKFEQFKKSLDKIVFYHLIIYNKTITIDIKHLEEVKIGLQNLNTY